MKQISHKDKFYLVESMTCKRMPYFTPHSNKDGRVCKGYGKQCENVVLGFEERLEKQRKAEKKQSV